MANTNFGSYIRRILKNQYPEDKLSSPAKTYLQNFCVFLIKRVAEISNELQRTGKRKTLKIFTVKQAALLCLGDSFGEGTVTFADKAVSTFENNKTTEKTSMATRAGLVFPPSKVHAHFSRYSISSRYSELAKVFTAAVIEDVVTYIIKNAGIFTKSEKKTTLSLENVTLAIRTKEDLYNLVKDTDNMIPEFYKIEGFLAYEQPKTKKEQKESQRPLPLVDKNNLEQEFVRLSYSAVKRLGYRAGLKRFGNQVSVMVMSELYNEAKKVFKHCLVSMNYNGRKTLSPVDVTFALNVLQGGTITAPHNKDGIIPKKTVQERKGRVVKTQATKTKEWKKKVMYYQKLSNHLFFARDSFRRLIKSASEGRMYHGEMDMQSTIGTEQEPQYNQNALDMIQLHCEKHVVDLLRRANNIAVFSERQTVQEKDFYLALVPNGVFVNLNPSALTEANLKTVKDEPVESV